MFEIKNFLPTKGRTINIRGENHGNETVPCIDWAVEHELANDWLDNLDKSLRPMFYKAVDKGENADDQPQLEGIEVVSNMPLLRTTNIKFPVALNFEFVGYQLTVDHGMGGKSNLVLLECKLNKFTVDCKEGGTVVLRYRIQAQRVSEEVRGALSSFIKGASTAIALKPPTMKQEPIDGTNEAFNKDHPEASAAAAKTTPAKKTKPTGNEAGDAFSNAHAPAAKKTRGKAAKTTEDVS